MKKRLLSGGDDRGQILIMTALSMVALLGVAALSLDASYMYDKRNRLHAAADGAAKSGAIEFARNEAVTQAALEAFADHEVLAHGFTSTRAGGTATVVVNHPPTSGPFVGHLHYVEVTVSEPSTMFFGGILGWTSMTPGARAVAGVSPGVNCIITLAGSTASPESMSLGNSTLTMPNCNVAAGGDLVGTNPNATINAAGTAVTGSCLNRCGNIANLSEGAPAPSDPLAGIGVPANPGSCGPAPAAVGGVMTIPGNRCYTRIDVGNNTTVNFGSGLIYLTGAFTTGNNPTVNGTGVVFYLAGTAATGNCTAAATAGCINVGNSATFNLSAPVGGISNGILFFQAPTNQLNASFDGNNPTYNLSGAMYFPNADVSFRNGLNASNDCMLFVARSLTIDNGNGSFSNVCAAYGGSPVRSVSLAE